MASYNPQGPDELEELMGVPLRGAKDSSTPGSDNTGPTPQKRKNPPTSGNAKGVKQQKVAENKAVYVTNLPRNATFEEIAEEFGRAGGIIDIGVDDKPRIKMYTNENGDFNGEALIVYFKPDSVALAIRRLDGYSFRPGDFDNGNIRVQAAEMNYKKNIDKEKIVKKMDRKDRKAAERTRAELNRKLAEWSDNEEEVDKAFAPKKNKWAKNAIVKNLFELSELTEDFYNETVDDMREAGERFGEVTKCVLYDEEPEGIVVLRFKDIESAEAFQKKYDGKKFGDRIAKVTLAEDRPKFKKGKRDGDSDDDYAKLQQQIKDMDDSD